MCLWEFGVEELGSRTAWLEDEELAKCQELVSSTCCCYLPWVLTQEEKLQGGRQGAVPNLFLWQRNSSEYELKGFVWGQGYRRACTPVIPLMQQALVPRLIVDFLSWAVLVVRFSGSVKEQGRRGWPLATCVGMGLFWQRLLCKSCFLGIIFWTPWMGNRVLLNTSTKVIGKRSYFPAASQLRTCIERNVFLRE